MRCESIRLLAWKGLTDVERYGQPGPEGSLVKWLWSDTNQRLTQLAVDIVGPEALTAGTSWSYELLRARGNTIEGGTTEVLKNIVAERVLGLPAAEGRGLDVWTSGSPTTSARSSAPRASCSPSAPSPTACASTPRRARDDGAVERAERARLARDRDLRGARRPGPRPDRAVDPLRGARPRARARPVPAERAGGARDRAGRLARAARALAAGARPRARLVGALGQAARARPSS